MLMLMIQSGTWTKTIVSTFEVGGGYELEMESSAVYWIRKSIVIPHES